MAVAAFAFSNNDTPNNVLDCPRVFDAFSAQKVRVRVRVRMRVRVRVRLRGRVRVRELVDFSSIPDPV